MAERSQREALTDGGDGVFLASFRRRSAEQTARAALIISIPLAAGSIARFFLEGGESVAPLLSASVWIFCDLLWWRALLAAREQRVDLAANLILVGIAAVVGVGSYLDTSVLALTSYLLGFPVLQICALTLASPEHLRLWSRGLPPAFVAIVLSRFVINPLPAFADPINHLTVAFGGAFGLLIIVRLSVSVLDTLQRALGASEEIRRALATANTDLAETRDQALAANHAKSSFLATMSHELRTPLNAIIGYTELLDEESDDPEVKDDLGRILVAAHHLLELINGVLDLAKIEAGRMDVYYEAIAIEELVRGIAGTLQPTIERGRNLLVVDLEEGLGEIESDLTKVRQILLNLASNAAKFTAGGVIQLLGRRARGEDGRDGIELTVEDSGIGIPHAKLKTIFDPFTQADASTTRRYGGTGLGLAITQRFVELLGGTIAATSEVNRGSRFTVWLPRRAPGASAGVREGVSAGISGGISEGSSAWRLSQLEGAGASLSLSIGPSGGAHVLAVDEEPEVHQRLRRCLVKEGYRLSVANSGAEGLEIARRDRPDLITLDVCRRGANGWELLCELAHDPALRTIPVVLLTHHRGQGSLTCLPVHHVLGIPVAAADLEELVDRCRLSDPPHLVVAAEPEVESLSAAVAEGRGWRHTAIVGPDDSPPLDRRAVLFVDPLHLASFPLIERLPRDPDARPPAVMLLPPMLTVVEHHLLRERARALGGGFPIDEAGLLAVIGARCDALAIETTIG